jgi:predicted MFS family arabinose efflux permease
LQPDGGDAAPATGMLFSEALRTRAFWLISATIALSFFASTTVIIEHIIFLTSRGFAASLVTTVVGLFGIAYLPGRMIVVYASRRVRLQLLVAAAVALEALGVILLLNAHGIATMVLYVLIFGGAYGALSPLRGAIMAERFGRRSYGTIISAQGIPIAALSALGPLVGGRLIDSFGYTVSFEGCIGALVLATLLMLVPL